MPRELSWIKAERAQLIGIGTAARGEDEMDWKWSGKSTAMTAGANKSASLLGIQPKLWA